VRRLLPLLALAAVAPAASARLIPYYKMDSLAYLSSDVVLCDEVSFEKKTRVNSNGFKYDYQEATVTVVRVLKGNLQPKQKLAVEIDTVYTRRTIDAAFGGADKAPPPIPPGRALLFLNKEKVGDEPVWRLVLGGVKLLVKGEAYTYGQFVSNPGPLWLAKMAPENTTVPAGTPFGEELLLKDAEAAVEKAKRLTGATSSPVHDPALTRP
jgi:hypothetical protein